MLEWRGGNPLYWFGKIIGALVGSFFGPLGLLFGLVLGHLADLGQKQAVLAHQRRVADDGGLWADDEDYIPLVYGLFGRVTALGGGPTPAQAAYLEALLDSDLVLGWAERDRAIRAFNEALNGRQSLRELGRWITSNYSPGLADRVWILQTALTLANANAPVRPDLAAQLQALAQDWGLSFSQDGPRTGGARSTGGAWGDAGAWGPSGAWGSGGGSWGSARGSSGAGGSNGAGGPASPGADREAAYRTLGLPVGASADEIKKAYRRLARTYHPDSLSHLPENSAERRQAQERFLKIQAAYERLT